MILSGTPLSTHCPCDCADHRYSAQHRQPIGLPESATTNTWSRRSKPPILKNRASKIDVLKEKRRFPGLENVLKLVHGKG
jgi:hypothetical protein